MMSIKKLKLKKGKENKNNNVVERLSRIVANRVNTIVNEERKGLV